MTARSMPLRSRRARRSHGTAFSFAPMVDVVLLLLIFFMTATTLGPAPGGLPVTLPSAASTTPAGRSLDVSVAADGRIAFGDREGISPAELEAALRDVLPGGDGAVSLRADRSAEHGRVVEVMDAIKRAGATRLSVSARPL